MLCFIIIYGTVTQTKENLVISSERALDNFLQYALFMPLAGALLVLLMLSPSGYTESPLTPGKKNLRTSLLLLVLVLCALAVTFQVGVKFGVFCAVAVFYICLLALGYITLRRN